MPEGDSVAGHARRLEPLLVGKIITGVAGTSPSLRKRSGEVLDALVTAVRTIGKHLVIDLDTGYSIRVHLGMSGRWVVLDRDQVSHGSARLVLSTAHHHVACHSAPTIVLGRTAVIDDEISHLGPDLLGQFDEGEFLRRARKLPDEPLAELLLNQRVLAGIGNVYKSEVLFLQKTHPDTVVRALSDERLLAVARRAQRLLAANVGRSRSTTGSRVRDEVHWVYGRAGKPCRRCGSVVTEGERGGRATFWCPICQTPP